MKFEDLNLTEKTLKALSKLGYTEATEVQEKAVPEIIAGNNLIVRSQTGTGKTAAFGIGLIERIVAGKSGKALVLTPTRELAVQVCKELKAIAQEHQLRIFVVYGGQSINVQIKAIERGLDILVATPGRLLDLGRRRAVHISEFDTVVLDEADHMLDLGFYDEVKDVLDQLPKEKRMLLLSATIDESILSIASKHIPEAKTIEIGEKEVVSTIKEEHVEITRRDKFTNLMQVLRSHRDVKTLIFMETKRGVAWLKDKISRAGVGRVEMLQGDMSQASRNAVLGKFKDGTVKILVATNVAARGLHIDDLDLIINYDKAETEETHLHRVGRTGRMGAEGKVVDFIQRKETHEERMSEDHPDFAWMREGYERYSEKRKERYSEKRKEKFSGKGKGKFSGKRNDRFRKKDRKKRS